MFRTVKQSCTLPIINADAEEKVVSKHGALFPKCVRGLVCGPSNCGKTNVIYNLLTHSEGLKFLNVFLYAPTRDQEKYSNLQEIAKRVKGFKYEAQSTCEEAKPPMEVPSHSIVIFDDVASGMHPRLKEYYSMGRHCNLDVFLLAQTYTSVPKHGVRDNANLIIVFRQDLLNLKTIHRDHASDITRQRFENMCQACWNRSPYSFLVIAKDFASVEGRYRCGFDEYIVEY